MREDVFLLGRPIESLQTMLRQLSYGYEALPFLAPDGRFGEETLEAVMIFQREFGLPVTGRVDNATWDEVVRRFDAWTQERAKPNPLRAFPARPFQLEAGDRDDVAVLVQTLFGILSGVVDGITDGEHDGIGGAPACLADQPFPGYFISLDPWAVIFKVIVPDPREQHHVIGIQFDSSIAVYSHSAADPSAARSIFLNNIVYN